MAVALGELAGILFILQTAILAKVVGDAVLGSELRTGLGWVLLPWPGLLPLSGLFALVLAARCLALWACRRASCACASAVVGDARRDMLGRMRGFSSAEQAGRRAGELAATVVDAADALEPYFSRYLPQRAIAALMPLTILAAVFPLDWISGLVLILTAVFLPLSMILIGEETHARYQRLWAVLSRLSGAFLDSLQGLATLKMFGAARAEAARVAEASQDFRGATMGVLRLAFLSSFMLELVSAMSIAIVAVVSGFRLLSGHMAFAPAYFILLAAPEYFLVLRALGSHYHARLDALGAAERIRELLGAERIPELLGAERIPDLLGAERIPELLDAERIPELLGASGREAGSRGGRGKVRGQSGPCSIALEDLHVDHGGRAVLAGACFVLGPGEGAAIMGGSGSGKSTILSCLLGFTQPSSGRILVDGHELGELDRAAWLERVAWLPQRPTLFFGSLRDNVLLGNPAASEEELAEALRQAQVDEFLESLPDGLDSMLGEGGTGLSSGQIQRVALARLFLRNPGLVLLDEPTAHLDSKSALAVEAGIAVLTKGRSFLLVTHRPAPQVPRILVLENGRFREGG